MSEPINKAGNGKNSLSKTICMNFCPVCELSEQIGKRTNCNLRSLRRERKHLSTETEIRMTEYGTGCLVRSLAGHDKGTYYIIVREDARYVYLADGRTKTAAKPKRKKRKHVQFSHKWDEALAAQFADGAAVQDEAIRYFIQKSLQGGI